MTQRIKHDADPGDKSAVDNTARLFVDPAEYFGWITRLATGTVQRYLGGYHDHGGLHAVPHRVAEKRTSAGGVRSSQVNSKASAAWMWRLSGHALVGDYH